MKDCSILMKDTEGLRSRFARSAMWSAGLFFLISAALVSALISDFVYSSKTGIALSMLAAIIFFVGFVVFAGRTLYLFLRYIFSLRSVREKIERLAQFVERHESGVAKTFVFAVCCGAFGFWLYPLPEEQSWETQMIFWTFFLSVLCGVLFKMRMKVSSFPFMKTKWLKQRPLMRCFVLAAELAIVAIGFSFLTVVSLAFVVLVFVLGGALVGAIIAGIRALL